MASEVLICNAALQLIKHSKVITALNQGTKEANACELVYEELRDTLLSMHNWNFAEGRVKLAQLSDAPTFGYKYAYAFRPDVVIYKTSLTYKMIVEGVDGSISVKRIK